MSHQESGFGTFLLLIGRIFISAIFVLAGMMKIMTYHNTMAMMTSAGVPMSEFLLIAAIIFELGGGLLLLFGWYTRFGAVLLCIFVVLVTHYFHSFWNYEAAAAQVNNMQHFLKNLSIVGALIYVFVHGPGRFSLDNVRKKA